MNTYCLFCKGGLEDTVIARLRTLGYDAFSPFVRRLRKTATERTTCLQRLLPGYVFMDSPDEPDWPKILRLDQVYRALEYRNGERALRPSDLTFVTWIRGFGGLLEISRGIQVGTKVRFIDGPLKSMSGYVCKLNKKRCVAAIRFGDEESLLGMIWCSLDVIDTQASIENPEDGRSGS